VAHFLWPGPGVPPLASPLAQTLGVMNKTLPVVLDAELLRKDPKLPVYVIVPYLCVANWKLESTVMVGGTINGVEFGRRSIKRMNPTNHSDWFIEYTAPICKAAGVGVGDKLNISLRLASTENPEELEALLANNPRVRASWNSLSEYARRTSGEHIRAGKTEATRLRRAQSIVSKLKAEQGL
jgi:Bacteriocin-protection, YdeI or OmpD-Associated/Domain of unknown function (DUF1905)